MGLREAKSASDIDLDRGFIILPAAIQPEMVSAEPLQPQSTPGAGPQPMGEITPVTPALPPAPPAQPTRPTTVRLSMKMTRQQLYASVNALANLADKAGILRIHVEASHPDGFDPAWLHNAVEEPLDEADVVREE